MRNLRSRRKSLTLKDNKDILESVQYLNFRRGIFSFKEKILMPCPFTGRKYVFCRSKFFVLDQKFIYILCQSQIFCARQKDDLHSVKLIFVPAQKVLKNH